MIGLKESNRLDIELAPFKDIKGIQRNKINIFILISGAKAYFYLQNFIDCLQIVIFNCIKDIVLFFR